jgi:hypothetical protein
MMPDLSNFSSYDINYYDKKEIKKYEIFCLQQLKYNLYSYDSYSLLRTFFQIGMIFEDEAIHEVSQKVFTYALQLLDKYICTNISTNFNPMKVALSIMTFTRNNFNLSKERTNQLIEFYGYDQDYFYMCLESLTDEEKLSKIGTSLTTPTKSLTSSNVINLNDKLKHKLKTEKAYKYHITSRQSMPPTDRTNFQNGVASITNRNKKVISFDSKVQRFTPNATDTFSSGKKTNVKPVNSYVQGYLQTVTQGSASTNSSGSKHLGRVHKPTKSITTMTKLPEIKVNMNMRLSGGNVKQTGGKNKTTTSLFKILTKNDVK